LVAVKFVDINVVLLIVGEVRIPITALVAVIKPALIEVDVRTPTNPLVAVITPMVATPVIIAFPITSRVDL